MMTEQQPQNNDSSVLPDSFPFKHSEWQNVAELSHKLMQATLQDDLVLKLSYMSELQAYLSALRMSYPEHPVLTETEADFLDDPGERMRLYQKAILEAVKLKLPTASIRMSLAELLLEDLDKPAEAMEELTECKQEKEFLDSADKKLFDGLLIQVSEKLRNANQEQ